MTKGQIEAKISETVTKFEINIMGRGPKQINTIIIQDLVIIRLKGFFSISEKRLAENESGIELLKKVRSRLFENEADHFKKLIEDIIGVDIISIYSDVSTRTGEKIIVLTVNEDIEKKYQK